MREREDGAPEAVHLGHPLDAERSLEDLLEEAARPEGRQQDERGDVARDDEGQAGRHGPDAPARHVGTGDEPGERDAEDERDGRDEDDEDGRLGDELKDAVPAQDAPGIRASLDDAEDEVGERQADERDDRTGRRGE